MSSADSKDPHWYAKRLAEMLNAVSGSYSNPGLQSPVVEPTCQPPIFNAPEPLEIPIVKQPLTEVAKEQQSLPLKRRIELPDVSLGNKQITVPPPVTELDSEIRPDPFQLDNCPKAKVVSKGVFLHESHPSQDKKTGGSVVVNHVDVERDRQIGMSLSNYNLNYLCAEEDKRDVTFSSILLPDFDPNKLPSSVDLRLAKTSGEWFMTKVISEVVFQTAWRLFCVGVTIKRIKVISNLVDYSFITMLVKLKVVLNPKILV